MPCQVYGSALNLKGNKYQNVDETHFACPFPDGESSAEKSAVVDSVSFSALSHFITHE